MVIDPSFFFTDKNLALLPISEEEDSRFCFLMLDDPENEWNFQIDAANRVKALFLSRQIDTLNLCFGFLPIPNKKGGEEWLTKMYRHAPSALYNHEGVLSLCYWMSETLEGICQRFKRDALDKYQLEGKCRDFYVEEHSLLLDGYRKELQQQQQRQQKLLTTSPFPLQQILQVEKSVVRILTALKEILLTMLERLIAIEMSLWKIIDDHPEFSELETQVGLLKWILNDELGAAAAERIAYWEQKLLFWIIYSLSMNARLFTVNRGDATNHLHYWQFADKVKKLFAQYGAPPLFRMTMHWPLLIDELHKLQKHYSQEQLVERFEHLIDEKRVPHALKTQLFLAYQLRTL